MQHNMFYTGIANVNIIKEVHNSDSNYYTGDKR